MIDIVNCEHKRRNHILILTKRKVGGWPPILNKKDADYLS